MQLRCRCMYGIGKMLTRFRPVANKTVYGGFIKLINKHSFRAKEALVHQCLKFSLMKPNNLVSESETHFHLRVVSGACMPSHVYTILHILYDVLNQILHRNIHLTLTLKVYA